MGSKKQNARPVPGSRNEQMNHSKKGRRKKARRREAIMVGSALVMVFAVAAVCFVFFFKVQQVSVVNSAARYADETILEASGIETGSSMLRIKPAAVSQRIEYALPYVEKAVVKRHFPDKVTVTVTYARASLAVETAGGYVLMNDACKVLQTGVKNLSDYTALVSGVEIAAAEPGRTVEFTNPALLADVSGLALAFADAGFLNVTAYDLSDRFNVTVEIDYRVDVKLGSLSAAADKLTFGKAVIDSALQDAATASAKLIVDLTTENTAYVRNKEDAERTTAPAEPETAEDGTPIEPEETAADDHPVG
ncbi:MAG: FtsQ-type POTRA domain-containing protein [Clostridia bacterium]|nr:FtsQ-type POTRA domain-containing protein [Clostridia bacterium]